MADGKTNIRFSGDRASGFVEVIIDSNGSPAASIKLTLDEASDFTGKLARCIDELARTRQASPPKIIIPTPAAPRLH